MKFLPISLLFLFCFSFYAKAQNQLNTEKKQDSLIEKEESIWQVLKYDGASVLGGVLNAYSQPVRWKGKDWATFGGIAAGTALLYTIDEDARDFFTDQEDDIPGVVKEVGFWFGKPQVNYGLTTGVYAVGLLTKNEKIRKTGVLLIASATAGGLIQTLSKTLIGRARPGTEKGNGAFRLWDERASFHSFPSGHTILSVTTAHSIAKQFKNPYIKAGIYSLGALSPISRLWADAHWLTDVVLGAAISIAIVDGVDNYLKRKERYDYAFRENKIRWNLSLGANRIGIVGTF